MLDIQKIVEAGMLLVVLAPWRGVGVEKGYEGTQFVNSESQVFDEFWSRERV